MSQSFLETVTTTLRAQGLSCIRTSNGRVSEFWGQVYGDQLTIKVQAASVELCWMIVYDNPNEPSHSMVLGSLNAKLRVETMSAFMGVKDDWIARVLRGF